MKGAGLTVPNGTMGLVEAAVLPARACAETSGFLRRRLGCRLVEWERVGAEAHAKVAVGVHGLQTGGDSCVRLDSKTR